MGQKKYVLVEKKKMVPPFTHWRNHYVWRSYDNRKFYRIKALVDIPEHGVNKGDLGGYVSSKDILSHEGSCWIGHDALVLGNVVIVDNAYIGDNAKISYDFPEAVLTIKDEVKIIENAEIFLRYFSDYSQRPMAIKSEISGNVIVSGNVVVNNPIMIKDDVLITDEAHLMLPGTVSGRTEISGKAKILPGANIHDAIVRGNSQIGAGQTIHTGVFEQPGVFYHPSEITLPKIIIGQDGQHTIQADIQNMAPAINPVLNESNRDKKLFAFYNEILSDIASYETDIAKIIKYPLMTDRTNPYTNKMVSALKKAKRLSFDPSDDEFVDAVKDLEEKFLAAESNALKISASELSEEEAKNTATAKQLLRLAGDEASSEHERKVAFTQGFKQLEGVITVPEIAIDTFRGKVGLKELEA